MRIAVTVMFVLFICTLSLFAHRYLWIRLVRDTGLAGPMRVCASVAIVTMCGVMFAGPTANRLFEGPIALLAAAAAFTWMGVMFYSLVTLGGSDLIRWAVRAAGVFDSGELSLERRLFLQRSVGVGAATAAALASGVALRNANALPQVKHVEVKLSNLPAHLDGFTIVQISD
ncbi:MAG TPA: hypothetical protein DCQ06_05790, partial [Myxococcales bacterium]|nr:hypothetical protein [Myxococcales bacterium]